MRDGDAEVDPPRSTLTGEVDWGMGASGGTDAGRSEEGADGILDEGGSKEVVGGDILRVFTPREPALFLWGGSYLPMPAEGEPEPNESVDSGDLELASESEEVE